MGSCLIEGVEALILESSAVRVGILAGKGADVFEFVHKPTDLDVLWRSPNGIVNPARGIPTLASPDGAFMDSYEGGWQELFPTLGGRASYYGAPMGEHGEVALLPWDVTAVRNEPEAVSAALEVCCRRAPFRLRRTMSLIGSRSSSLIIEEEVINEGGEALEFMWGHHPVFGPPFLEPGCTISLPGGRVYPMNESGGVFRPAGVCSEWPLYTPEEGRQINLSRVGEGRVDQVSEFYVTDLPSGEYVVRNPRLGISFALRWDLQVFPYLWWWRNLGPAPGYPWYGKSYMLGLEPFSSVPPDFASACQEKTTISLEPGAAITSALEATVFADTSSGKRTHAHKEEADNGK